VLEMKRLWFLQKIV